MVKKKMPQVAAVNNFDKLIGKNGELAELRKEQVLTGAIGIIQRQYAGRNKMEAIAALFGKKLGEEFKLTYNFFNTVPVLIRGRFMESGFELIDLAQIAQTQDGMMLRSEQFIALQQLLTGEAEIVEDEGNGGK